VDVLLIRFLFILIVGINLLSHSSVCLPSSYAAVVGLLIGAAIIVFEWRLRAMSLKRLIGAAIG